MGIPSYFSYIIKNHPVIIKKYVKGVIKVHNLYMDCNSVIYDVYHKLIAENIKEDFECAIIQNVISKITYYIHTIQPSETVFITFDGVAPVAKLEQQRSRRYKTWVQTNITRDIYKKTTEVTWNTSSITPGTSFMANLTDKIRSHFLKADVIQQYKVKEILFSGSDENGEGEHKIYNFIRCHPAKHSTETTVVYGLDADLIMLSINHLPICPNIYLFRETPQFIQSIDSSLEPNENYFLDIPALTKEIILYMSANNKQLAPDIQQNRIYDYIFLSFFLGNDFLPHFPSLNIRTGGMDKLLGAYRETMGKMNDNLTNGKVIYWKNVRKMVQFLVNKEEEYFIAEHKLRGKREHANMPSNTPDELFRKFESQPTYERDVEKYINPNNPYWQKRYYRSLFHIISDTKDERKTHICVNYLEGLEWTMKYYTSGCPNWRWRYKYHFPPLLSDLIHHIPIFQTTFVQNVPANPVTQMVQLCYVTPRANIRLLPPKIAQLLLEKYGDWYKEDCDFVWSYCKYFWESHVVMNEIDLKELENWVD